MRQIRQFHLIDPNFHGRRSTYFLQATLASIALGLITFGSDADAVLFILSAAAILSAIRLLLIRRMTNLL